MKIIAHRGFWQKEVEQNTPAAFQRAFENGFGVETDIRDYHGSLVISHDMPLTPAMSIDAFFELYRQSGRDFPLALNIKSDGLCREMKKILTKNKIENYFVFDMSVPDTLGYLREKVKIFTRQSEWEREPVFYDLAQGVWLDELGKPWITEEEVAKHCAQGKAVGIVSAELHRRSYRKGWENYKRFPLQIREHCLLCTDYPMEARKFFNGQN